MSGTPEKPTRVLLFDSWHERGGGETYVLQVVTGLSRRGFAFVVGGRLRSFLEEARLAGAETFRLPLALRVHNLRSWLMFLLLYPLLWLRMLLVLVRHRGVDKIHLATFEEQLLATPLACLFRLPVTWSVHGPIEIRGNRRMTKLYRRAANRAIKIIAVSQETKVSLMNHGVDESRIVVIHHGVDVTGLEHAAPSRSDWLRVNFVGRLDSVKDPLLFIEMAALVAAERQRVRFTLYGEGRLREACQRRIEELGLADRIRLAGYRSNIAELYADTDVVVLTSEREGFGNVLVEAAAAGVPVVATDIGAVREIVIDGQTGLVRSRDVADLAEAVTALLKRADLRQKYGEAARRHVAADFSLERMLDRTAAVYREALGKPVAP